MKVEFDIERVKYEEEKKKERCLIRSRVSRSGNPFFHEIIVLSYWESNGVGERQISINYILFMIYVFFLSFFLLISNSNSPFLSFSFRLIHYDYQYLILTSIFVSDIYIYISHYGFSYI